MTFHIVELVVQMVIFLLLSAAPKRILLYKISAPKRILLYKICCALVQHSLSTPESFIVTPNTYLGPVGPIQMVTEG